AAVRWPAAPQPIAVTTVAVEGDTGDGHAETTFDGAMVRKRAAIAIHPARGADRAHIRAELTAAAKGKGKVGSLTEATFAVFDEQMLAYLVPEITMVLPEGKTVHEAEAFMRDYQPADVAFYLTQTVLVHDLTFAVMPAAGMKPAAVRDRQDAEGILTDALGRYQTTVQPAGLTVHYFGAILSDVTIAAVRDAMGRAAKVAPDRIVVAATQPGPGVDLANGIPFLNDIPAHGHH
ncbi:MAG TPA: hypothetical protein VGB74_15295, partial [Actinoplanes sp.]